MPSLPEAAKIIGMAMLHCRPASVGRLGIDPQLASWDRAGSPSQLRLANFLTHVDVTAAPMIAAIPARRLRDAGGPGIQLRLDELAALKGCLRLPETVRQLERRLARCHPSNRPRVQEELALAVRSEGRTVFDWIVGIFAGRQVTLELL